MFAFMNSGIARRTQRLSLFPLKTVLFPGGVLPLKVFEQRYVELVKQCLKDEAPFGVCLIIQGAEVAARGAGELEFAKVGTTARIVSCDVPQLGIFHVATRGEKRFQVQSHETAADGLVVAQVADIPGEPQHPLPDAYAPLARLLELIAARVGSEHFPDSDYGDASWVGYRLAELLPLPLSIKQSMLEINDAPVRLEVIRRFCVQQHLLES